MIVAGILAFTFIITVAVVGRNTYRSYDWHNWH